MWSCSCGKCSVCISNNETLHSTGSECFFIVESPCTRNYQWCHKLSSRCKNFITPATLANTLLPTSRWTYWSHNALCPHMEWDTSDRFLICNGAMKTPTTMIPCYFMMSSSSVFCYCFDREHSSSGNCVFYVLSLGLRCLYETVYGFIECWWEQKDSIIFSFIQQYKHAILSLIHVRVHSH